MKKLLLALGITGVVLAGCGSSDEPTSSEPEKEKVTEEQPAVKEQEEPKAEEQASAEASVEETGEFYEEGFGGMKVMGIGTNEEVGLNPNGTVKPIEMGPVKLTINGVAVVDVEPEEDMKFIFNDQDNVRAVLVDMVAENTSEDDITFHPNQSVIVTDTGEQVESEMMLMGDAGGDFLGKVTKEGQTWWLLKNIDKDVKKLTLIISPPHSTDDWEDIGEEKRIEFEVLPFEEAKEMGLNL